jgi:hypothetical protein
MRKKADAYCSIQHKIEEFGRLNERLIHDVASKFGPSKRKSKKKTFLKKLRIARNRKMVKV